MKAKHVTAVDVIAAREETDAAWQRLMKDCNKACCNERLAQYRATYDHERELIHSFNATRH